jgi:hypothetical protein
MAMDLDGGPPAFSFPKNLKDMPWDERQKLHDKYVAHVATASGHLAKNVVELDVAKEMHVEAEESNSFEYVEDTPVPVGTILVTGATFDPQKGYVVRGEDPWLLVSLGRITQEEAESVDGVAGEARSVSDGEVSAAKSADVRRKVASLPASSRDAVERFGRL